jgi:enoyl-CoA hydratase/carnithine racemase
VYKEILYSVDDPVATITLNRPEKLNAWTRRMAAEFRHAVYQAEADRAVVGIVVTGAGRAFCAGADMKSLESIRQGRSIESQFADVDFTPAEPPRPDFNGRYTWLMAIKKPVVAAINGPVAGMAVPIVLACDIRIMAADAPLITAFAERGLIGEFGVAWLLPRLVGVGNALDLLLSSRRVTGADAAAMGLVQKAVPANEVLTYAVRYVQDLAERCSPASLAILKRQVYENLTMPLGPSEKEAVRLMETSFRDPDFKEGISSFTEKRQPRFERIGSQESQQLRITQKTHREG